MPWGYTREKCVSYELCQRGYTLVCQHSPSSSYSVPVPLSLHRPLLHSLLLCHWKFAISGMHISPSAVPLPSDFQKLEFPASTTPKTPNFPPAFSNSSPRSSFRTLHRKLECPHTSRGTNLSSTPPPLPPILSLCSSSCSFDKRGAAVRRGGAGGFRNTICYLRGIDWQVRCKALGVDWGR